MAGFIDFQDGNRPSPRGDVPQSALFPEIGSYSVGKRYRTKVGAASIACRSLLPIDIGGLARRELPLRYQAWPQDWSIGESSAAAYATTQRVCGIVLCE